MGSLGPEPYIQELINLAPKGAAWALDDGDSLFKKLIAGLAQWAARVDARIIDLLLEADPRTTTECITDWERVLGLPDNCGPPPNSLQKRRGAAAAKYSAVGGQTKQYLIDLAETFGFNIQIDTFKGYRAGGVVAGDTLSPAEAIYYFKVTTELGSITNFRAGASTAGDPIVGFGDDALECLINKYSPGHTDPVFSYVETP